MGVARNTKTWKEDDAFSVFFGELMCLSSRHCHNKWKFRNPTSSHERGEPKRHVSVGSVEQTDTLIAQFPSISALILIYPSNRCS